MTENEAKNWLSERDWLDGRIGERLHWLVDAVLMESDNQNLISAATRESIWARHIVDSAQLLELAGEQEGLWLDIGTGAGFPGVVIACLRDEPVVLVEPRPLRVAHLQRCIAGLELHNCSVLQSGIGAVTVKDASVISARAYAALERIFSTASHVANLSTSWVLPKGRNAQLELETAQQQWQGVFHVKQSVTDLEARIIVANGVEPRKVPSRQTPGTRHSQKRRKAKA